MFKNGVRYAMKDYYQELDKILNTVNYGAEKYFEQYWVHNNDKNSKLLVYCKYFSFVDIYDFKAVLLFDTKTSKDEIGKIVIYDKSIVNMFKENESLSGNKTKVCKKPVKKIIKKSKRC